MPTYLKTISSLPQYVNNVISKFIVKSLKKFALGNPESTNCWAIRNPCLCISAWTRKVFLRMLGNIVCSLLRNEILNLSKNKIQFYNLLYPRIFRFKLLNYQSFNVNFYSNTCFRITFRLLISFFSQHFCPVLFIYWVLPRNFITLISVQETTLDSDGRGQGWQLAVV